MVLYGYLWGRGFERLGNLVFEGQYLLVSESLSLLEGSNQECLIFGFNFSKGLLLSKLYLE